MSFGKCGCLKDLHMNWVWNLISDASVWFQLWITVNDGVNCAVIAWETLFISKEKYWKQSRRTGYVTNLQILRLYFLSLTTYARYQTLVTLHIFPQPPQLPNGSYNLLRRYSTGINPVTGAYCYHQWFEGLWINQLTPQRKRRTVVKFPEKL